MKYNVKLDDLDFIAVNANGYIQAFEKAKKEAGIEEPIRVRIYREDEFPPEDEKPKKPLQRRKRKTDQEVTNEVHEQER